MRSARIRRHIQDDSNRWLLSYADIMTLLFAFFVVMYATSKVNEVKFKKKVMISVESALQGSKVEAINKKIEDNNADPTGKNVSFKRLGRHLQLSDGELYKFRSFPGWYELEIKEIILFKTGRVVLNPEITQKLTRLAKVLKAYKGPIVVEGYTDNIPIHNTRYGSNWTLSAMRAAAVAEYLDTSGLQDHSIAAVGYGAQYPIASNLSTEGREKNRRVIIVIAKNAEVSRMVNPIESGLILYQEARPPVKTKKIKSVKEVKTKSGVKFTQKIEERPINNGSSKSNEDKP